MRSLKRIKLESKGEDEHLINLRFHKLCTFSAFISNKSIYIYFSLCANINRLDARCEDLQRCLDETRLLVETSERKNKSSHKNSSSNLEKKLSHSGKSIIFLTALV